VRICDVIVIIYMDQFIFKGNALYILESSIKRLVRSSVAATVAYTASATLGWMCWTYSTRIYGPQIDNQF